MRAIGVVLLLVGSAGTAWAVRGSFAAKRPVDIAFALAAPVALGAALVGMLLIFVPAFFS